MAFVSEASNLDPLDTDTVDDVYVKELSTGDLFLVSATQAGVKGNGVSNALSISGSGRMVAFSSQSTNLDPADTDSLSDIYVKDLATGELTLVSTSDTGVKGGGAVPAISGDGRRVAFQTTASLDPSDTGGDLDVYVKDLVTGDVVLVSASSEGVHGNDRSEFPAISGEGRRVAFESLATNLHSDDPDSIRDVYVKQPVYCTSLGTAGDDVIAETPGDDILCGGEGADTLQGRGGDDLLLGEGGEDVLVGGAGADELDGGAGADTADYGPSPAGVIVFLEGTGSGGHADGDTYSGVEDVQGTPFTDELYGDAGPNRLLGGDGLDILAGDEGDDALLGEGGEDFLAGGPGADAKDGGPGSDFATYGESPGGVSASLATGTGTGSNAEGDTLAGVESLSGSPFDDVLEGDAGNNELLGGQGNDLLTGGAGADVVAGDQGLDVVAYGASPAPVTADLTAQTVSGGDATGDVISGIEGVLGSAFDDTLIGSAGQNAFMGMAGADVIDGAGGADLLSYRLSPAGVTVDLAAQTATGGHATGDVISGFEDAAGSELADILAGSVGANLLLGYGGNDTLYGLDGDDTLVGAGGTDTFFGGTGTDTCDDTGGESATSCEL